MPFMAPKTDVDTNATTREVMSGVVPASFMSPIHCSTECNGAAAITATCRNAKHCEQDDQADSYPFLLDVEEDVDGSLLALNLLSIAFLLLYWSIDYRSCFCPLNRQVFANSNVSPELLPAPCT